MPRPVALPRQPERPAEQHQARAQEVLEPLLPAVALLEGAGGLQEAHHGEDLQREGEQHGYDPAELHQDHRHDAAQHVALRQGDRHDALRAGAIVQVGHTGLGSETRQKSMIFATFRAFRCHFEAPWSRCGERRRGSAWNR